MQVGRGARRYDGDVKRAPTYNHPDPADSEVALLKGFVLSAARGLRYPENHLARLGI
jgi:hypothetical protein